MKTYPGYITLSANMYGWRPVLSIPPGCWGTEPNEACRNCKTECTKIKAPACAVIFPKPIATLLLEEGRPEKYVQ